MFDSSFLDIETHRTLPLLHPFLVWQSLCAMKAYRLFCVLVPPVTGGKDMKMEYTYKFNDGTQNTVSVSETIGKVLEGLDRKAENLERKERYYRQLSIDTLSCADKGELLPADEVTPETLLNLKIENELLKEALLSLTETQRRRLLLYAEGYSYRKIAEIENVGFTKIAKSVENAREKMLCISHKSGA